MDEQRGSAVLIGDHIVRGVIFMILGMAVLNAMDAVSKLLTVEFSGIQVAWARYTFHFVPLVLFMGPTRLWRLMRTNNPGAQILRSTSLAVSAVFIILAFGLMPLADAIAVSFVAPLMIVALSSRFLGERIGIHRWVAVVVGFVGMLILVWPSGDVLEVGTLFALAAAVFWAIGMIMTRQVRNDDLWSTLLFTALVGTVLISLCVPFFWRPPTMTAWLMMLAMGLLGGIAHTLIILAFRHASASLLAPYNYTLLVWAVFYGWILFDELPDLRTTIGAVVIVAAGIYVWHRERLTKFDGASS
ncbi:MAG: DMT family transporter [Rhizobiaceae bacterium]